VTDTDAASNFWKSKIAAFAAANAEAVGDQQAVEAFMLYAEVAAMSEADFAANRKRLGLDRSLGDFLLGR
jgi:hypothetical protein